MRLPTGSLALSFAVLVLAPRAAGAQPLPAKIDFNRDVRPILSNNCFACHGPDEKARKAKLRLDIRDDAVQTAIVPGKPDASEVITRVTATPGDKSEMPPAKSGKRLTAREVEILTQWVREGAPYSEHWAYVKPVRPPVPVPRDPKAGVGSPGTELEFAL